MTASHCFASRSTLKPCDSCSMSASALCRKVRSSVSLSAAPPLDEPLRTLAASNYNSQTAAHPKSPWVFRGYRPGMHLTPTHLRNHLRPVLASLEARLGTLNELTQTTPIAILAETL